MATLVIRNIDDALHARLKDYAAAHGHSMEEEVRRMLRDRLAVAPGNAPVNWVDAIRALVEPLGGIELADIDRGTPSDPPDFSASDWDAHG